MTEKAGHRNPLGGQIANSHTKREVAALDVADESRVARRFDVTDVERYIAFECENLVLQS